MRQDHGADTCHLQTRNDTHLDVAALQWLWPHTKPTAHMTRTQPINIKAAKQASTRSEIDSFIVMDVMRAAAELEQAGANVIHMEVGQPSTPAPKLARDQLAKCLETENLGYTLALGNWPLRERIAQYYDDQYGLNISPNRIIVTTGSSGAFVLAFLSLFDTGDRVGLPNPGYPCYRHILSALGQQPITLPTGPETRWMPTPQQIATRPNHQKLSGLIIASPANPTGTMIAPDRLSDICQTCAREEIRFISDEIYHGLTYDAPAETALRYTDDAIVINSFSKYYSMTGWRVGWMVVPDGLIKTIEKLAQNFFISAPAPAQRTALAALDAKDELEENKAVYASNRKYLLKELPTAGFPSFSPPDGAFYLYCDISHLTNDSYQFARAMLKDIAVATTPGIDFDADRGRSFIRFCYANSHEKIVEAVQRIKSWTS